MDCRETPIAPDGSWHNESQVSNQRKYLLQGKVSMGTLPTPDRITILAQGKTMTCDRGANLRAVLINHGVDLYNGASSIVNCRGLGTCGTCTVQVEGTVSEPNGREQLRLSLPPHRAGSDRRLACQTKVLGDLKVSKCQGFWGQSSDLLWSPEG